MSKSKIIVITQECDPSADAVIARLRAQGEEALRVHVKDFPIEDSISIRLSNEETAAVVRTSKGKIELDEVKSIWWRKPLPPELPGDLSEGEAAFTRRELNHALNGLWTYPHCYWMSVPGKIRRAEYKSDQLKRAAALGLRIPRTLITLDPEEAVAFCEACGGRVAYKVMTDSALCEPFQRSPVPLPPAKVTYTTLLSLEQLKTNRELIRATPCLFQEYVEKRVELRIIVVGDELFVTEIDSQAQDRTRIDWRHYDVPMLVRRGHLPGHIAERCLRLVHGFGLEYSAMDMIVTPAGEFVFLENNPNGQWEFVQRNVPDLDIAGAIADRLGAARSARTQPRPVAAG